MHKSDFVKILIVGSTIAAIIGAFHDINITLALSTLILVLTIFEITSSWFFYKQSLTQNDFSVKLKELEDKIRQLSFKIK